MSVRMVFKTPLPPRDPLRAAIDRHRLADETGCVQALLAQLEAALDPPLRQRVDASARRLAEAVRAKGARQGGLDAFLAAYGLSTREGVCLMRLAEALLRVPDAATRSRLIRDKLGAADWDQTPGGSHGWSVGAATRALRLARQVTAAGGADDHLAGNPLRRLVGRLGTPVVRAVAEQAMAVLGRQFVMAEGIEPALARARSWQARGYRFSFDMLGEAARTRADADRYTAQYRHAIQAIGARTQGLGPIHGPGISVKLSALHPRYEVAQHARVLAELLPSLRDLCREAARFNLGLSIDAEEADRLDLSLECIEAVSGDPTLAGWTGFGVVVQAYQKRAPYVLDFLAEMARRHGRRLAVRLVKGAYWDTEIKRAQEAGLSDYPVFTRKVNTDVSYLACARRLLDQPDVFFPQFATHNAHTVASVLAYAGDRTDFECQRLYGMGDALYQQVMAHDRPDLACRIYAPVGPQADLLAYLVRRLLENGANSSFLNQVQDETLPVERLVADPIQRVRDLDTIPHPRIPKPRDLYAPDRLNAAGIDLSDRVALEALRPLLETAAERHRTAGPVLAGVRQEGEQARSIQAPYDRRYSLGQVSEATDAQIEHALALATQAAPAWAAQPVADRAACLERAADLLEAEAPELLGLVVAEVGKTLNDAVSELREAIDFCRYYAAQARPTLTDDGAVRHDRDGANGARLRLTGGGVFACISPWNLPLAIFTGQITAALVAGNAVVAKPAEQSPLIATLAVGLLHRAGVPPEVLALLPGNGARVGGALVRDPRVSGVCFTGSVQTARAIQRALAQRDGPIAPLIAETGGQNAMIVDSTALTEQVVRDVLTSAFQNAGQRCSALRVLFVQEDVADRTLAMLAGAMDALRVGDPRLLDTDVGPVIDETAQAMLTRHIQRMRTEATELRQTKLGPDCDHGCFVAPTAFEIAGLDQLEREHFGPILHVVRYRADRLPQVIAAINASGYGLTLGIHSRIDATWQAVAAQARVENIYVNRNQIGAIVGVQPFGGQGLSGTGPKAGGPLYLPRFVTEHRSEGARRSSDPPLPRPAATAIEVSDPVLSRASLDQALQALDGTGVGWSLPAAERAACLETAAQRIEEAIALGDPDQRRQAAAALNRYAAQARAHLAAPLPMPGPTGERNELSFRPRGVLACLVDAGPGSLAALIAQTGASLAAGNPALLWHEQSGLAAAVVQVLRLAGVPATMVHALAPGTDTSLADLVAEPTVQGVAWAGDQSTARALHRCLAAEETGPLRPLILFRDANEAGPPAFGPGHPLADSPHYLHRFVHECALALDTTAAGGNAALLSVG